LDTTRTVLQEIASYLEPASCDWLLPWAQVIAAIGAALAVFVAVQAFLHERNSRTTDALLRLLSDFERKAFFIRMWRMDQMTRTDKENASTGPKEVHKLLAELSATKQSIVRAAIASDWNQDRADMYGLYFFAVRTHAWLKNSSAMTIDERTRLLNDTFGYQLLSTLLNHRIVACRLRVEGRDDGYHATHYGVFDPRYTELVDLLARDLLADTRLPDAVRRPLKAKRDAINDCTKFLKPLSVVDAPPEAEELQD